MSLVAAKCTQCGANLEVDDSQEAAICQYCKTPFITEKAINNYVTNNSYTTNITAQNVYMTDTREFVIVAGELKEYRGESADVVIPEGVSSIGTKKEMYEDELTDFHIFCFTPIRSIKLPKSITEIDAWSFYDCHRLKKIELADTVTFIGEFAFKDCISLEEINIPSSVKKIGYCAFENCTALKSISIPEGIKELRNTFTECKNLKSVSLPNSIETLYCTFDGCTALETVVIPDGVSSLESTFHRCRGLKEISVVPSVKEMEGAFYDCVNLTSVTILGENTKFDHKCFIGCTSLKTLTVHKKNKKQAKKALAELKRGYGLKPKLVVLK